METFKIDFQELEGRLDPFFYKPKFNVIKNISASSKYETKPISYLSDLVTDGIHKTPTYSENGLPFIQVNNIKEGVIDFNKNIKYVSSDWKDIVLQRYKPQSGDILITKDGTIGIAATVPDHFKEFSIFVSVAAVRPKSSIIIPKFLEIMINSLIVQKQIYRQTRGAVLVHLLLEEIRKLIIPLPPYDIQKKIVQIMDESYLCKQQNEKSAEILYNSIDDYLLNELKINKTDILIKKTYNITSNFLTQTRIDPYYHQPLLEKNEQAILNSKYDISSIKQISNLITSGQRPKGGVRQISEGIPSLGGEHINEKGFVAQDKLKFVPLDFHKNHLNSSVLIKDILIVKDGATTGKVGFVPEDYPFKDVNINEHLFLIRVKEKYNPYFIFSFLRSSVSQTQIKREITGATVTGLVKESIDKLHIPIPPIEVQNKIASEIKKRRDEAENLLREAAQKIFYAKKEIENMLFK